MPHLLSLPSEIYRLITEHLDYASELNTLGKTCRTLYGPANLLLYSHFVRDLSPKSFCRIVKNQNADALRKVLPSFMELEWHERFFDKEDLSWEADAASSYVEIIQIFVNLYGPGQTLRDIASDPKSEFFSPTAEDRVMFKLLADAAKSRIGEIALNVAAAKGCIDCVRFLLYSGCKVDAVENCNRTALWNAAHYGQLEAVEHLLEAGANPNARGFLQEGFPKTPIYYAAMNNDEAMVRCLLQKNAHLGTPGEINAYAVGELADEGREALATLMLEPLDLDTKLPQLSPDQMTCFLHYAVVVGDDATIEKFGCPPAARELSSVLRIAAKCGRAHSVKTLLERCANVFPEREVIQDDCHTTIQVAAQNNQQSVVTVVLEHAENHAIDTAARVGLLAAAGAGHKELCQIFVGKSALKKSQSSQVDQSQILGSAIWSGDCTLVEQILDEGNLGPWTILFSSETVFELICSSSFDLFKMILKRGVVLDPSDLVCRKALSRATISRRTDISSHFLQNGFDANDLFPLPNGSDRLLFITVSSLYGVYGEDQTSSVIKFLLDHGAKVDAVGIENRTALATVAWTRRDCINIARELLDLGADPLLGFKENTSALQGAIETQKLEMVELFLEVIAARGHQCDGLTTFIARHIARFEMPEKSRLRRTEWWNSFFLLRVLRSYYWRTAVPMSIS
ncbi:ankyrin repeat-containing domain protein [Penicillium robsamsonii]|uniref:ankyrin repeat-containing domain protein n=1 Tax=Penicillium robsamsonii TaxID=1792511 RepID=UPI0025487161|nr:ankyrin repeat-containing domain protein [Penicillium robsamsonii]KAJ5827777.1 ankyrin repeat-containing domain protein [Penicillium robsamsonii]